jgi:hypothetical protein
MTVSAAHPSPPRGLGSPRRRAAVDCLLLLLAAVTAASCLADPHGTVRVLAVLAAACLIPGGALLTRLPVEEPFEAVGLAVGLGFTVEAAGALAMLWIGFWHPVAWALVLGGVACAMLAIDLRAVAATLRDER